MTDRKYTPAQRRVLLALTGEWIDGWHAGIRKSEYLELFRAHADLCEGHPRQLQWRLTSAGLAEKERIRTNDHK